MGVIEMTSRLKRYNDRRERNRKIKRERHYAMRAKEAKIYYGVPNATHAVVAALVEWRKGEKCRPFDRLYRRTIDTLRQPVDWRG